jgi:hypothetical protein
MQARLTDKIRSRLRGKSLGLFDLLADGGPVEIETLFEGLNSQEGDFGPSEMDERIRRYAAQLNLELGPHGLRVTRAGACGYMIEKNGAARQETSRTAARRLSAVGTIPTAREKASVFFFEKKNQKTFAPSRSPAG